MTIAGPASTGGDGTGLTGLSFSEEGAEALRGSLPSSLTACDPTARAVVELGKNKQQICGRENNQVGSSHLSFRRRERATLR